MSDFIIILLVTAVGWWISGYDSRLTGEDYRADFIRRAVRTGITCFLIMCAVLAGRLAVQFFTMIGITWASCVAELGARIFHRLVDPEDDREFDPQAIDRNLDRLGLLIKQGRINEALDLCKKLQDSSEGSHLAIEATLHRLYDDILNSSEKSPLLADVRQLIDRGEFEGAESRLKQILTAHPENSAAALLLMRMYAVNLSRPDKALAMLQPTEKQMPRVHPAFAQLARQSINDWTTQGMRPAHSDEQNIPAPVVAPEPELSVGELLESRQLATAVERLEKSVAEEPRSFDLWLKLAEVYGVYCADFHQAGKVIQKMERTGVFRSEEVQQAKARLREWQSRK